MPHLTQPVAHVNLVCIQSNLLLERVLQALRYRGFAVMSMTSTEQLNQETEINLIVKGQGKLTTLQKSLEALIEVQQCHLTTDQAKLASLIEYGLNAYFGSGQHTQPGSYAAEGA